MIEFRERREHQRDLTDRLLSEYADALPPGQIIAAVARAHRLVVRGAGPWPERMELCESLVRHQLARRAAEPVTGGA